MTLLEACGALVTDLPLLDPQRTLPRPRLRDTRALLRGHAVPETQAWGLSRALSRIDSIRPDVVICVTARAYHPRFAGADRVTVLDFVDSLARSYHGRALISRSLPRRAVFHTLSAAHRRFESSTVPDGVRRVAAGWSDARHLDADWVPILAPRSAPARAGRPDVDLVFFGNLSYLPNVEAVRRLARIWPALQREAAGTSAVIAGARPTTEVRDLARRCSWELVADFPDLAAVAGRAKLACFPLAHTAGIQIKVLEAAALGLAQVVCSPALAGLEPGFPATVADDDRAMVVRIVELLRDDERRHAQADAARRCAQNVYGVERWRPWISSLLDTRATSVGAGPAACSGVQDGHHASLRPSLMARAMTRRWISRVPSKMV